MKTAEITKTVSNGSTYISTTFDALGNTYSVVVAKGKNNYISIRKETNNPHKLAGKEFTTWNDVIQHYKSPAMNVQLLMIETLFQNY